MGPSDQASNPKLWSLKKRILFNPFILVGACILYFGVSNLYQAIESTMWPIADGTILKSEVAFLPSNDDGSFCDDILYQFKVAGKLHRGNVVAVGKYCGGDPSYAQGIVNRFPKGKNVKVHYRTSDPDTCLLEPGLHGQTWCVPFIGLVCFAGGILMTVFLPRFATPLKMRLEQSRRPPRG
jgi:hypothetical protein